MRAAVAASSSSSTRTRSTRRWRHPQRTRRCTTARRRRAIRPRAPSLSGFRADRDAYDESISELDDLLAELLKDLDASGLSERTLLVDASDHGEAFR